MRRRVAATGLVISALALVPLSCGGSAGEGKEPGLAQPPGVPVCLGGETPGASCATEPAAGPQCPGGLCIAASVCVDANGAALDPAIPCPGGDECPTGSLCPDVRLQADEVQAIIESAARALDPDQFEVAVAVTDRRGVVLGIGTNFEVDYRAACAASACPGQGFEPGTDAFTVDTALQLARTPSFFSADQTPLTSRSVRFISGEHFPAGVARTGAAALFGIENTNRGCSFDRVERPAEAAIPRARNLCSLLAEADGAAPIPCESSIDPADQCGCTRGILTLPGAVPIYRGVEGGLLRMAGGVGVFARRIVPVPDPVAAYPVAPPGPSGILRYDDASVMTTAGQTLAGQPFFAAIEAAAASYAGSNNGLPNFAPRNLLPICDNENIQRPACCFDQSPRCDFNVLPARLLPFEPVIFIDGIEVPEVATNPPLPAGVGTFGRCSGSGATCRVDEPSCPLGETCAAVTTWVVPPNDEAEPVPQGWLVGPFGSTPGAPPFSAAEVTTIIDEGFTEARRVRGGIRLPLSARTAMMLAVSDGNNFLRGLFRMQDATVFSIDVSVAKSRNVTYFSSEAINPMDTMDCPGPSTIANPLGECRGQAFPAGTALTNRTISFGAQPFFPSGIEGLLNGYPFPFTPGPFRTIFLYDSNNPCTNGLELPDGRQNGIVFFPGSTPIYRNGADGDGPLIGGYGVSGDGVEQDDIVSIAGGRAGTGAQGLLPNSRRRADQIFVRGVRLPFVKFNRRPEQ